MYCYIYDDFIQDKKFEKELSLIENRLTDLGISGKILRLAMFRNAEDMLRDEIRRGIKTVVVVGNDPTIRKVIDTVADSGVSFGIIPLGDHNQLARILGIPHGIAACDVLSARIIEEIDMGIINGRRFITGLSSPKFQSEITCDNQFRITPKTPGDLEIFNLGYGDTPDLILDPRDGKLDAVLHVSTKHGWGPFKKSKVGRSHIPAEQISIRSDNPIAIFADGEEIKGTRFDISVEKGILKVITGKGRLF